jgi:hypothetical protein
VKPGSPPRSMSAPGSARRGGRWRWLWLATLTMVPALAISEGDVRVLDCSFIRTCTAEGACRKDSGHVSFRLQPIRLDAAGAGSYTISYGQTKARMQAISRTSPFIWTVGNERDTLLASSDGDFLWHRMKIDPAPQATIRFMRCSFSE